MIICANCSKENIRSSKFCGYCGSKIDENQIYCPVCKTKHNKITDNEYINGFKYGILSLI